MAGPIRKVPSQAKAKLVPEWAQLRKSYDRDRYLEKKESKLAQAKPYLDEQGRGECWICRNLRELRPYFPDGSKSMAGLLCKPCSLGIQKFEADPDLLEEAASFLRRWGKVGDGPEG